MKKNLLNKSLLNKSLLNKSLLNKSLTNNKVKNFRPLGSLEEKLMGVLWNSRPLSVREVNNQLGEKSLAHTTVMTTLDRLYKKGLLSRTKFGLAFIYRASLSQDEYQQWLVGATVSVLMSKATDTTPVLAAFVNTAAELNEDNLTKLETLIAERRKSGS